MRRSRSVFILCFEGSNTRFNALILVAVLLAAGSASAQQRRIQLDDLARVVTVSDPQFSPDGKSIVCVVSRPNFEEDRHDNELVLIDVASSAQKVLTYGRKDVASPRWSSDGERLAFLATVPYVKDKNDDATKREDSPQVFVMPMNGGDAKKITNAPRGVEQFAWRPDGKDIAYVTSDDPPNQKEIEKHNDSFEVGDNDYLTMAVPTSSHIWLVSAGGGEAKRLTSGAWSLPKSAPPSAPASPISWARDGKSLTFTRQEHPHFGDSDLTTLQILNVETGEIRKLTNREKFESFGVFSPDGSQLAYWYPRDDNPNNVIDIFVASVAGDNGVNLTRELDRNLQRAIWMPTASLCWSAGTTALRSPCGSSRLKAKPANCPWAMQIPHGTFGSTSPLGQRARSHSPATRPGTLPSSITWHLPRTRRSG